jgi:hypothetical protein
MARQRKTQDPEDLDLERVLELLDARVLSRRDHVLAELDDTAEIVHLAEVARTKGATMVDLAQRVKRVDRRTRELVPVTRQALDTMLATGTGRREARTTRASRRRREPVTGGQLNADVFAT